MTSELSPRVTICLPTIGRLTYMQETLDSLKAQTLDDYELLILYNGTDSAVLKKLQHMAGDHPGGRVLPDENRMAMFANFNRGLREARGEYIAFFHDDDAYEPNFLSRTIAELDAFPHTAFAGSNYYIIDSHSRLTGHRRLIKRTLVQPGHDFIRELIRRGRGAIPTPGIVFRKSVFDERGWDESLSMHFGDFVVLMEMAETHDAMLIAEPLLRLRLHGRNASNVPLSTAAPMLHGTLLRYVDNFEKRWPHLADFARQLRNSSRATLRRFLVWGWVSADDELEAQRCTALLRENGHRLVAAALDAVGAIGLGAARRRGITGALRKLGRVTG